MPSEVGRGRGGETRGVMLLVVEVFSKIEIRRMIVGLKGSQTQAAAIFQALALCCSVWGTSYRLYILRIAE